MEAALPFESVRFDLSVEQTGDISSMNAEQYLSWVRYQANKLPSVKRVDIKDLNISNRQSQYMPQIENILTCSIQLLPLDEWKNEILYNFSEIRMQLEGRSDTNDLLSDKNQAVRKLQVPAMKDEASWYRFCLACECNNENTIKDIMKDGLKDILTNNNTSNNNQQLDTKDNSMVNVNNDNNIDKNHDIIIDNNLQIISKRKRKLANQLGIVFSNELFNNATNEYAEDELVRDSDDDTGDEDNDVCLEDEIDIAIEESKEGQRLADLWLEPIDVVPSADVLLQFDQVLTQRLLNLHINWLEEVKILTTKRGQWFYGLLARLEKPLYRETVASIRELYRRCCYLRYHLVPPDYIFLGQEELSDKLTSELAILNTIITITGDYFGQSEDYFDEINNTDNTDNDDHNIDDIEDNEEDNNDMEEENEDDNGMYIDVDEELNNKKYNDDDDDDDCNIEYNKDAQSDNSDDDINTNQQEELEDGEEVEIQVKRIKK